MQDFWNTIKARDPRLFNHPVRDQPGHESSCIPLRMHGDAVPFGKGVGRSLATMSLSSLLTQHGASWDNRFLVYGLPTGAKAKQADHGCDTMEAIWDIVAWSLRQLTLGVWPSVGPDGQPLTGWRASKSGRLCGPWTFCMLQIAADLDYLASYLHMTHFNAAGRVCMLCQANRADLPWSDVRPGGPWQATRLQGAAMALDCHPVFRAGLGLSAAHVVPDILHCLDLGVPP